MTDSIESRWRALLERGEPESREVDAQSPLRMVVGLSIGARPYFAIIVSQKPGLPCVTSAIDVTRRQRSSDGRWSLTLELQLPSLTDAFISLVSDLAAKSIVAPTEQAGLEIFLETLQEWRELLTIQISRLSENSLRGLIAELWFGFLCTVHGHALSEAVHAWAGPLGGAQDFQFLSPGCCYEVKSLRPGRFNVEISSAEQLDGRAIKLAIVTIDEVADTPNCVTLPVLLQAIRSAIKDGVDRSEFNRRFARLSVNPDDPWYADHAYVIRRLQIFDVSSDFPALRRSELPEAIAQTNYLLDIRHISKFIEFEISYSHQCEGHHGQATIL
jgi:hypothetical protein